ncbi:MAG: hypothetical protein P4L31_06530 [Candidatus Babeliales bacterium]|nr:hypothetical protein [Candidatus Babeliales bacterium]
MNYRYLLLAMVVFSIRADDIAQGVQDATATVNVSQLPVANTSNFPQVVIPFVPVPAGLPVTRNVEEVAVDDSLTYLQACAGEACLKACCCQSNSNSQVINPVQPVVAIPGVNDSGVVIPPDTQGAVGPNHLMITLNDTVTIQNKSGGVIRTVTLKSFWASLGNPTPFDPRVTYDPYNNRWIFIAAANAQSASSSLLVGVSQTSDPTGVWNLYRIDVDAANLVWIDNPTVGFNKNWITVQGNMFNVSNDAFNRSYIYAFNKARLYAHLSATFTRFSSSTIGGSQVPAQTFDPLLNTQYLIQNWNGNSGGKGYLRLYQITGAVGSEVFAAVAFPTSPSPWASSAPLINKGFAPQKGTTLRIDNNDARIQDVVYRNGSLWTTQTIFLPATATPTHSGAQWWQINTAGTVLQRGRIEDPLATATNGRFFYAFPSIAVNKQNDALVGYSRFSSGTFASAAFSYRLATDAANTMRASTVFQPGLAIYTKDFGSGDIRWGDYSNSVVDPINGRDFWTIQEYANSLSGSTSRWGVEWAKLPIAARGFGSDLNGDSDDEIVN